ncbi:MAG: hypothetical protein HYX32_06315 [Actinobacteria bacterium]|nr:hypothetical protein [Actinomycetota bacterium]
MRGAAEVHGQRRRHRALFTLPLALVLFATSAFLAQEAQASDTSATVNIQGHAQNLNDAAGQNHTFLLTNTGTEALEVVIISRPSTVWTVTGCPKVPSGWVASSSANACTFRVTTPGKEIAPGGKATFGVKAKTSTAGTNQSGSFGVVVSRCQPIGECFLLPSAGDTTITAYGWTVTNAKVWTAQGDPPAAGTACGNVPNEKTTVANEASVLVICGKNNMNGPRTALEANSSLGGSLVAQPGSFTGGEVPAASGDVVIGSWTPTIGSFGTGRNVLAGVGSAGDETSRVTTLWGFAALVPV